MKTRFTLPLCVTVLLRLAFSAHAQPRPRARS